jgi:hypothetical protein
MKMVYKLFVWKKGDIYVAVFPEIDVTLIEKGLDKEQVKDDIIQRAASLLRSKEEMPENKSFEELQEIIEVMPVESLISASGIKFE